MTTQTKPRRKRAPKPATILMLRTCRPNGDCCAGGNHTPFRWPFTVGATLRCPDPDRSDRCGGGLHGLPWGVGSGKLLDWSPDAVWLVFEAAAADVVEITEDGGGKSKSVGVCTVRYAGERGGAIDLLIAAGADPSRCVAATHGATGDLGAASATGYRGAASATGDRGAASATGYRGAASATGDRGAASATGDLGAASATGDLGAASATGKHAIAVAIGRTQAGPLGTIVLRWWDAAAERYRCAVGYVGEDGIEAGVWYATDGDGRIVRAADQSDPVAKRLAEIERERAAAQGV